jgi:hypothetical protein
LLHRKLKRQIVAPLGISVLVLALATAAIGQSGEIVFQTIPVPSNVNAGDRHSNAVIRSARDWMVWVNNLADIIDDLPVIDFEHYTLLVSNAGFRTNGPYEVKFDSVTDMGPTIRVHVSVTGPASCPAEPQSGHYVAMAVIPSTDKPIQFDVATAGSTCPHR